MKNNPDMSVRVRCYNHKCRKLFEVNLVKGHDTPDGKKVEMIRSCPNCGKDNAFKVAADMAPDSALFRTVREAIKGRKA